MGINSMFSHEYFKIISYDVATLYPSTFYVIIMLGVRFFIILSSILCRLLDILLETGESKMGTISSNGLLFMVYLINMFILNVF